MARNGPSTFLYFYVYDHSAKLFKIDNRIASDFARGATGGMCATLYAFLFNVIKSRQQAILDPVQSNQLARYEFEKKNVLFLITSNFYIYSSHSKSNLYP